MKLHQQNNSGATLLEVMAMLTVLALALTTMFVTLMQGINFSRDIEARISAINLAREGIEGVINIRNTNWLRFSSDRTNCWDTLNYNVGCIGADPASSSHQRIQSGSYLIHNETNKLWTLSGMTAWNDAPWSQSFINYTIGVRGDGWYTGDPGHSNARVSTRLCNAINRTDCRSMFARDIVISNKTNTGFTVTATVHWFNNSQKKVSLTTEITNWKSLYNQR